MGDQSRRSKRKAKEPIIRYLLLPKILRSKGVSCSCQCQRFYAIYMLGNSLLLKVVVIETIMGDPTWIWPMSVNLSGGMWVLGAAFIKANCIILTKIYKDLQTQKNLAGLTLISYKKKRWYSFIIWSIVINLGYCCRLENKNNRLLKYLQENIYIYVYADVNI